MVEVKYKEAINYDKYAVAENHKNIDDEIAELIECLKDCKGNKIDAETEEIYQAIRKIVMREIKYEELAVTKILADLQEIRKKHNVRCNMITAWIINNDMSYDDLGKMYGVSKQYIHGVIYWAAKKYKWIDNLRKIKGEENTGSTKKVRKNSKRNEKRKEVSEKLKMLVYHPALF